MVVEVGGDGLVDADDSNLKDAIARADAASDSMAELETGRKVEPNRFKDALVVLSGLSD